MQKIDIIYQPPTPEEFVKLRKIAGLQPKKITSAEKGIYNSLFWVTVRRRGKLIGMGRVVGDGGTVVQIADIAVDPKYQRMGYGELILNNIKDYILAEIPDDAFVCLFSEKAAITFYGSKEFELSEKRWPGMYWPSGERVKPRSDNE